MTETIDISGLDKAVLLMWLHKYALPPQGIAALHYSVHDVLDVEAAQKILLGGTSATPYTGQLMYVEYVLGRKLHIDLSGNEADPTQYDRANGGEGKAALVVEHLRTVLYVVPKVGKPAPTEDDADPELTKLQAYAAREQAQTAVLTGEGSQEELDKAQADYESAMLPGNKNNFVPWIDPGIPFECGCGTFIWADTEHTH